MPLPEMTETMTNRAMLKGSLDILRNMERGICGFVQSGRGPCYLALAHGGAVRAYAVGHDVTRRFECFSLGLELAEAPMDPVTSFETLSEDTEISVLLREEYLEPFAEHPVGALGQNPLNQIAAKPGQISANALVSCLVAYGLLIEGAAGRLAVVADWLPYTIEVTTDSIRIAELLEQSEPISPANYAALYGFFSG